MKAKKADETEKVELRALYAAMNIHRRALEIAARWTCFDPFGAVVYVLRDLTEEAWNLREEVISRNDDWNYAKEPYYPLRPYKWRGSEYDYFKDCLKGLEGAIRRFLRNPWIADGLDEDYGITVTIDKIRDCISELKAQM